MKVFGHKPSEIRKAIAGFAATLLVLLVALPLAGLPAVLVGAVASVSAVVTGISVYLSKPNVVRVVDAADALPGDYPADLHLGRVAAAVKSLFVKLKRAVGK